MSVSTTVPAGTLPNLPICVKILFITLSTSCEQFNIKLILTKYIELIRYRWWDSTKYKEANRDIHDQLYILDLYKVLKNVINTCLNIN